MSSSHRKVRPGKVFAFGHGSTLHVWEVRLPAVLAALSRSLRPRRAWSRVIVGLAVFLVVMAIIGALSPRPTSTHATGKSGDIAAVSPIAPAPPAQVLTFGQGEVQTTDAELAANLGRAFGARGDIYLVPRLPWATPGTHVAWVWPAGCDHDDHLPCRAVGLTYDR